MVGAAAGDGTGTARVQVRARGVMASGRESGTSSDLFERDEVMKGWSLTEVIEGQLAAAATLDQATLGLVGLDECRPIKPSQGGMSRLRAAATGLRDQPFPFSCIFADFVRVVAFIADPEGTLASCSFYELPGVVFLGPAATQSLLPSFDANYLATYALTEALLHEALHQELCRTDALDPLFCPGAYEATITIPWRKTQWSYPHAMHTLYVYAHLAAFRRKTNLLEQVPSTARLRLIAAATTCADPLASQFRALESLLTEKGRDVLALAIDALNEALR